MIVFIIFERSLVVQKTRINRAAILLVNNIRM